MQARTILTIRSLMAAVASCFADGGDLKGYQLVWADEFENGGEPNPINWTYEHGFVRNEELQWYQSDNAFCENGFLVIEGLREHKTNPRYEKGSPDWRRNRKTIEYTSACLTTKGRHSWKYGRFEIKARIKTEKGLWPAIWFLGVDGHWPHNGEIDLMEFYDGNILANACWGTGQRSVPEWDSTRKPVSSFNDSGFDQKFHVWCMDWDEHAIKLYIDGILLNTIDLAQAVNPDDQWGPKNPFHQPQYLLLNLAIGGKMGGDPSHTDFPTRYEIDYVRVYKKMDQDHSIRER